MENTSHLAQCSQNVEKNRTKIFVLTENHTTRNKIGNVLFIKEVVLIASLFVLQLAFLSPSFNRIAFNAQPNQPTSHPYENMQLSILFGFCSFKSCSSLLFVFVAISFSINS